MIKRITQQAKEASKELASKNEEVKNLALSAMAEAIEKNKELILKANQIDLARAEASGMSKEMQDRLVLTTDRINNMVNSIKKVILLPDPIGEVVDTFKNAKNLLINQVRVPLGLIAIIYESRPNVTVDACALALKSGNAVVLRGSSSAFETNKVLVELLKDALAKTEISPDNICFIESKDRAVIKELLSLNNIIDLVIPRGGKGLINFVVENAKVPVIETGVGNCHLYIDEFADIDKGLQILMNGKTQRPSVCNALETLLVHEKMASDFLPRALNMLSENQVIIYGCERTRQYNDKVLSANKNHYAKEFLNLEIAVKIVNTLDDAIEHIKCYTTNHSESIITDSLSSARKFVSLIDSSCVYVNASTRFSDGEEFGFGAEIGISTQKLHSRGPMGLKALTSYKYVIYGDGQIRE